MRARKDDVLRRKREREGERGELIRFSIVPSFCCLSVIDHVGLGAAGPAMGPAAAADGAGGGRERARRRRRR